MYHNPTSLPWLIFMLSSPIESKGDLPFECRAGWKSLRICPSLIRTQQRKTKRIFDKKNCWCTFYTKIQIQNESWVIFEDLDSIFTADILETSLLLSSKLSDFSSILLSHSVPFLKSSIPLMMPLFKALYLIASNDNLSYYKSREA